MRPQVHHITRRRGVYYYRRRLPSPHVGEVALSLRARCFREAEHLADHLDDAFQEKTKTIPYSPDVLRVLREHLRQALDDDLEQHRRTPPGRAVYTTSVYEDEDPVDIDLDTVDYCLSEAREAQTRRDHERVASTADQLMEAHGIEPALRTELVEGLLQVQVQALEVARRRVLGEREEITPDDALPAPMQPSEQPQGSSARGPKLSAMLDDF